MYTHPERRRNIRCLCRVASARHLSVKTERMHTILIHRLHERRTRGAYCVKVELLASGAKNCLKNALTVDERFDQQ